PHVSSGVRSAGCNLIATRVFGMSETLAITGKSVKLFKGHYTRFLSGKRGHCLLTKHNKRERAIDMGTALLERRSTGPLKRAARRGRALFPVIVSGRVMRGRPLWCV
ncbi:MAG: hypothetical protein ACREYE_27500, partial [Gammaproteobacteria bacterium]